jgi:hypothetical protein
MVLSPAALMVRPEDMTQKIGVWDMMGCSSPPSASSIIAPVTVACQNDSNMNSKSHLITATHQFEPKYEPFLNL